MVLALVGVSMLIFILVRVIPGDPIALAPGPMADKEKETIEEFCHKMGFDRPTYIQYLVYVGG